MPDTLTQIEFRPLVIPTSIDADDAADFREMVRVRNIVYREISGHDDGAVAADELLPHLEPDDYRLLNMWVVVDNGRFVGRIGVEIPLQDGSKVAFWFIELLREVWGRGIGSAAYELVEQTARDARPHGPAGVGGAPAAPGPASHRRPASARSPRITPRASSSATATRWSRSSATASSISPARSTRSSGCSPRPSAASTGYRVVQWFAPTPPEFAEGYAWMKSRMSTDAPAGGTRVRRRAVGCRAHRPARRQVHRRRAALMLVTAAQHIETGELCAFNELSIGKDRTEATQQEDTLVLKEHRGHKLGTLVKCAGAAAVAGARAGIAPCHHLQRGGESPHARHQRGDRLRPDRLRRRLEEGAR